MDALLQDLKFAVRMLRKSPATTAVAVLTLGIAIGATTAIFTAVDSMILRPLAFPGSERLVVLQDVEPQVAGAHGLSWPEFEDLRAQAPDLAGLAAYVPNPMNLSGQGEPQVVDTVMVSRGFFQVLGLTPLAGRFFSDEEHVPNAAPALVATEGFWRRVLGRAAPGTTVLLDGVPFTLVGVSPSSVTTVQWADAIVPIERKLPWTDRGEHYLETVGRLKPDITVARAQADLRVAAPRIAAAAKANHLATLQSLHGFLYRAAEPILLLLFAAVGLVLLIASVNLAGVTLSRATGRIREFAVRRALGASGGRLARQILVENALLGVAGGSLGVLIALWGRDLIVRFWPYSLPPLQGARLDLRVLGFTALVSLGAGLGVGLMPALHAARDDLQAGLKEGAGASSRSRARSVLVVLQSALAVVLVACAALVLQSLSRMIEQGPGFHAQRALSVRVPLPPASYSRERRIEFFRALLERVSALPGVRASGVVSRVPLGGGSSNGNYSVVGRPPHDDEHQTYADKRVVSAGYFAAMEIPIVRGRPFADSGRAPEIVINQALARREFPGEDPIGRQIGQGSDPGRDPATIVGVAADVKQQRLNLEPAPEIYYPQSQTGLAEMELIVRTDGNPMALLPAVKAQIAQLDPAQPVTKVRTLEQILERSAGPQRLLARLLTAFAAAALLLATLGIYGVVSYSVSRREREIGVRMALGAQAGHVVRMVLREGLRLSLLGVLAGALLALALARLLAGFLYGVSATDPLTYALASCGLALAAALACWLPARRATRVDPAVSLRAE
ncbi:MAG: ABC transporter permease [Deltaproteobacteria bacterium]